MGALLPLALLFLLSGHWVLAIIFGALGVRRANGEGGTGKGLAITGIVTGIVAVVISVLFLAVIYAAVTSVSTTIGALPN